jgi:hypothetical protein
LESLTIIITRASYGVQEEINCTEDKIISSCKAQTTAYLQPQWLSSEEVSQGYNGVHYPHQARSALQGGQEHRQHNLQSSQPRKKNKGFRPEKVKSSLMVPLHSQASTVPNVEVKDPAKRMDGADPLTKVESEVDWQAGSGSEDGFLQPVCAGIHQDSAFVVAHNHQGDRARVVQHAMPVPKATLHVRDRVRGHSSGLHHNSNIDSRVWLELLSQHIVNLPVSPEIVKVKSKLEKVQFLLKTYQAARPLLGPGVTS